MSGLVLDRLAVTLHGAPVAALDAQVSPGEILTVMGPSGSGKSTLLAAITGTLDPAFRPTGRVRLDGRDLTDLPTQAREVGLFLQEHLLFPHLSVGGNLLFGLPKSVRGRAARRAAVEAALAEAGLEGFADRDPATLSGGQRARAALLRTLLARPRALLLDEPFSTLDAGLRGQIRAFVFDAARRRGLPTVLVTHDEADAEQAGGRIVAPNAAP